MNGTLYCLILSACGMTLWLSSAENMQTGALSLEFKIRSYQRACIKCMHKIGIERCKQMRFLSEQFDKQRDAILLFKGYDDLEQSVATGEVLQLYEDLEKFNPYKRFSESLKIIDASLPCSLVLANRLGTPKL